MSKIILVALVLLGTACATKAGTGALIGGGGGAAAGAGVGALLGGGEGALIGAGVGGAIGAGGGALIGHYMDNQQEELNRNLQHARVVREGDKLVVHFSSAILFATDGSQMRCSHGDCQTRIRLLEVCCKSQLHLAIRDLWVPFHQLQSCLPFLCSFA